MPREPDGASDDVGDNGAMALVAGIDSSTQSTKVEVRDADTGELVATRPAPHPHTSRRAANRTRGVVGGVRGRLAQAGAPRSPRSRSPASSTAWSCSTTRARSCGRRSSGTTPSPRPTPAGSSSSSGARPRGPTRCGSVPVAALHDHQARRGCTAREPDAWAPARARLPAPRLAHAASSRVDSSTDRGDASGTGYWSPGDGRVSARPARDRRRRARLDRRRADGARARATPPGDVGAGAVVGRGHGRQHGRRRSASGSVPATSPCRSGRRAPCTPSAKRRPPTRPAPWPASPTRPAATCRSSARSTRRR